MKQVTVVIIVLLLAATLVMAGTKRIETVSGSLTVTLNGNDSTGFQTAFTPVQISEMTGGSAGVWENRSWDKMVGSVIMPNLTPQNSDSVAGENAVDTLIVRYKYTTKWYTVTAETDTCTLPCTTQFVITDDVWADYTESIYGDSTAATIKPLLTGDFSAFMMDQFSIQYYVSDTAGTNGVDSGQMSGELMWFFKFFEDE